MRGRRRPSSPVSQQQTSMALRKQAIRDAGDIPSGSQQVDTNSQDSGATNDGEDNDELSSSLLSLSTARDKRRRERENKSKPKEMTEEEMMDLALRLSEQEANITALRLQKEEEAVMKAIQESMNTQTESQSLLADGGASHRLCSRRKLLYSNGKAASAIGQGASEDDCTPEIDLTRGVKRGGDENKTRNKKRKRKDGSPLPEMPDLSQTQKIYSQASPSSFTEPLDSPQSCDSTQIDDCELRKSPVFPATGCKTEVHIPRLSQDLLQTCRTSGFVLCSQESWTSLQKSLPAQKRSPTFPQSPQRSSDLTLSKSPVLSETEQEDDGETQLSPEYFKSPVFGRNTQHEKSTSACKPQVSCEISGFTLSSQETLTPSVMSTSCRPKSPVFPRSPGLPSNSPPTENSVTCKSPVSSETDGGHTRQSRGLCPSPVFGRTQPQQKTHQEEPKRSVSPSAAESRPSGREGRPPAAAGELHRLRQDRRTDLNPDVGVDMRSESDPDELTEPPKDQNSAEKELSNDMILLWSDDDEDVTPVGSPSPVFPEETSLLQADVKHTSAASPGTSGSNRSRQQLSITEQEPLPVRVQGTVSEATAPLGEGAAGPTVHYYWGIPFCPRGLDPDNYTQVILAQMETYEKSLKQAQRCLLRKAEWGEAILPQPEKSPSSESPQQHGPRRRAVRLRGEAADSPAAEREKDEDNNDEHEREDGGEEKKSEGEEEVHVDTDDCEVCPETQLSVDDDDRTQDLMMDTDARAEAEPKSPELPEVKMISQESPARCELQEEERVKEEQEEEMEVEVEVDAPVDKKTRGDFPLSRSSDVGGPNVRHEEEDEDQGDPDVEEIKGRDLQRSSSPKLEPAAVPPRPEASVDCPICQGSFPVTEIEMHAAYCDGEVAVVDERRSKDDCFQVSLKSRRRRTRRSEVTDDEASDPPNTSRNLERCYICQKSVHLRDYSRHTELCIRSKTAARGSLLSALEQTESRDSETAGPSGSKLQSGDVIDLLDDDEEDEQDAGVSSIGISNSPIRSFTPISEASGCLIDFKKQQRAKRLNQRRR